MSLNLGNCQGYWGLSYHMEEAYLEKKHFKSNLCPPIALFSNKYYNEICDLNSWRIKMGHFNFSRVGYQ